MINRWMDLPIATPNASLGVTLLVLGQSEATLNQAHPTWNHW